MLALLLALACDPTDPVEACVRVNELGCACGRLPEYCTDEVIQADCAAHAEAGEIDVEAMNCAYEELSGCEKENWTSDEFYGFAQEASTRCAAD